MDQPSITSSVDDTETQTAPLKPELPANELEMKPDHVPDKFWNPEQGAIRTDVLLKSYGELERRLGDTTGGVPDTPDSYQITTSGDHIQPDADINNRLHAAGFTQEQAQLVYDLAHERLAPLIEETTAELHLNAAVSQLETHFGGKAKWQETSRQLKLWGQTNLPPESYENLSASVDGILVMHRMMQNSEPPLMRNLTGTDGSLGEKDLKKMMQDPRYWRDQEPAFVEQVRKGFQTLYPE